MKRLLLLLVGACVTCLAFGLVSAAPPVVPGGNPAPGLVSSSYACYEACVLPVDVVVGDYNSDGWTDIAVSCSATGQVMYYQNQGLNGPGVFLIPPPVKVPSARPRLTAAGDLELASIGNYVLYGAVPTLGYTQRDGNVNLDVMAIPDTTTGILTADLHHNTRHDIVLLSRDNGTGTAGITYVNPGTGVLAFQTATGDVVAGALADMNGDSWTDVVVITAANTIEVFYNDRYGGGFTASEIIQGGNIGIASLTDVAVGDFNADGLNDIVVVGTNPPNLGSGDVRNGFARVFVNTLSSPGGPVGFSPVGAPMATWGFNASAVEVFDADGNGRDDFAVANKGSATVTIFLADALPQLLQDGRATRPDYCLPPEAMNEDLLAVEFRLFKYELQCGYFPIALDSADFDWNGKADLVVVLQSPTESMQAQEASCIEIVFDVACGFHQAGDQAPAQRQHKAIQNVKGESDKCEPCGAGDPCSGNTPPESDIEVEGDSGNP
jgi:VCBS repeat protein